MMRLAAQGFDSPVRQALISIVSEGALRSGVAGKCASFRYIHSSDLVQTPTGKGFGLDSSVFAPPVRQRSKRPCSRLIKPVYQ